MDAASQRLDLTAARCPDLCVCASCEPGPSTACRVPALEPGLWNVFVNGDEAFELPVDFDSGLVPPPPTCVAYAAVDACGADPTTATRSVTDTLCLRDGFAPGDDLTLELQQSCGTCGELSGVCAVSVEPRFTADLPPGGELHVVDAEYYTSRDIDCREMCVERTRRCAIPPLTPGDFYRVWLNDNVVYSFTVGASPGGCVDLTRDLAI